METHTLLNSASECASAPLPLWQEPTDYGYKWGPENDRTEWRYRKFPGLAWFQASAAN